MIASTDSGVFTMTAVKLRYGMYSKERKMTQQSPLNRGNETIKRMIK